MDRFVPGHQPMHTRIFSLVTLLTCAACAGSNPHVVQASAQDGSPEAPRRMQLGHFTSPDGAQGLVIDRTGGKLKVRLDGSKHVLEPFAEEEIRGNRVARTLYRDEQGLPLFSLDEHGHVEFNKSVGTVNLYRDGDAKPLGAPSQRGRAADPTEAEKIAGEYAALSVVKRFAHLLPEDAVNLAKVREAMSQATADMFVSYTGDQENGPAYEPGPSKIGISEVTARITGTPADPGWDKGSALAPYGAVARGATIPADGSIKFRGVGIEVGTSYLSNASTSLRTYDLATLGKPLAAKTPGLLWDVGDGLVFVTLDGARYRLVHSKGRPFARGLAPKSEWPAPLQHTFVDRRTIELWGQVGVAPSGALAELDTIAKRYQTCSDRQWASAKDRLRALSEGDMHHDTRNGRAAKVAEEIVGGVDRACGNEVASYEKTLIRVIEARNQERRLLMTVASARAVASGAAK
jgi:hypothetical protein